MISENLFKTRRKGEYHRSREYFIQRNDTQELGYICVYVVKMTDVAIKEKCDAKSLWLSSEAIPQEVFCANKITRSSVVKLT